METLLQGNLSLDCVNRLFYSADKPDYLPIIGSSALEQILSPSDSSSAASCCSSSSSGFGEMERMSPDSTMTLGLLSPSSDQMSNYNTSSHIDQHQPDSTTHDLSSYDSDAFDSEDSVSSFAEVQANTANAANAALLWPKQLQQDVEHERRARRSMSTSSSDSYSDESGPTSFSNILSSHPKKVKQNKRKKTKRAEEVVLKCQLCEYTTRFREHLTSHMHTHDSDRNYMCSDCGQTFKWSHSLKRHQRTHQTHPDFRYACNYCFKTFSRKDHLTIHEDLHTNSNETFPCHQCGATFKNRKTLTGHMKTHTSQKDFKCDECDSKFTRRASLNRHVRAAHAGQVITCTLCPAVFSYRSTLEDHKKAAHNEGKREFGCSLCGVQFAVKAYLSKHMVTCRNRAVGRSFACSLCGKSFPTKRHLNEHGKRKHPTIVVAQQQLTTLLVTPTPDCTTTTTTVKCETSRLPPMTSTMPISTDPQMSKPIYHSKPEYAYQGEITLQDQSSQILAQNYSSMYDSQSNGCYMFNSSPVVPHQQQHNNNQHCNSEEENVGSLLRLVYSCPDQILDNVASSYIVSGNENSPMGQTTHHYYSHQPQIQNGCTTKATSSLTTENIMDYPMLDGIPLEFL